MTSGFIVGKGPRQVRYMRGVRRLIATVLALLGCLALLARPAHADVASSPARTTAAGRLPVREWSTPRRSPCWTTRARRHSRPGQHPS
jgi:hypothetical protein